MKTLQKHHFKKLSFIAGLLLVFCSLLNIHSQVLSISDLLSASIELNSSEENLQELEEIQEEEKELVSGDPLFQNLIGSKRIFIYPVPCKPAEYFSEQSPPPRQIS